MKAIWFLLILFVAFVLSFILYVLKKMSEASKPTTGSKIEKYSHPQKALVVIDVQEDYTGSTARRPFPYPNSEVLIENVNWVIDWAYSKNFLVAYVNHEFPDTFFYRLITDRRAIKGFPGAAMNAKIKRVTNYMFTKEISDSFSSAKFEDFLISQRVNELVLVGLDGVHCVYKTGLGGVSRGYNVTILKDCIFYRTKKSLDEICEMYSSNGIKSMSSDELMK